MQVLNQDLQSQFLQARELIKERIGQFTRQFAALGAGREGRALQIGQEANFDGGGAAGGGIFFGDAAHFGQDFTESQLAVRRRTQCRQNGQGLFSTAP